MTTITEPGPEARLDEKVAFGAAELDRLQPGWYRFIDLEALDLWHDEKCILGQLHETYEDGLEHFRWTDADAEIRGFIFLYEIGEETVRVNAAYRDLTDFWCQEINARLRADEAKK